MYPCTFINVELMNKVRACTQLLQSFPYLYDLVEVWWQSASIWDNLKLVGFRGVLGQSRLPVGWLGHPEAIGHWDFRRVVEGHLTTNEKT